MTLSPTWGSGGASGATACLRAFALATAYQSRGQHDSDLVAVLAGDYVVAVLGELWVGAMFEET